jgi:hypothetical protein
VNKVIKTLGIVAAAALVALSIVACGGGKTETQAEAAVEAQVEAYAPVEEVEAAPVEEVEEAPVEE